MDGSINIETGKRTDLTGRYECHTSDHSQRVTFTTEKGETVFDVFSPPDGDSGLQFTVCQLETSREAEQVPLAVFAKRLVRQIATMKGVETPGLETKDPEPAEEDSAWQMAVNCPPVKDILGKESGSRIIVHFRVATEIETDGKIAPILEFGLGRAVARIDQFLTPARDASTNA